MSIKVLEEHQPKPLVFFICKGWGFRCPPVLYTFKDALGKVRREAVPL